jgi:hypothetical protein
MAGCQVTLEIDAVLAVDAPFSFFPLRQTCSINLTWTDNNWTTTIVSENP